MMILGHQWGPETLYIPEGEEYDGGIPVPPQAFVEIVPSLFQGGALSDYAVHVAVGFHESGMNFDCIVSLMPDRLPTDSSVNHVHLPMLDSPAILEDTYASILKSLAKTLARKVDDAERVLIRCEAGLNRSGLLTALILMEMGMDARSSIDLIREKRSPWALCNRTFHDWLLAQ